MPLFGPNVKKLKAKGDIKGLIEALSHNDWRVRNDASRALGQMRNPSAVEPLIKLLNGGKYPELVMEALGEIGGLQAILALSRWPKYLYTRTLVHALGKTGDERAAEPIIEIFNEAKDPSEEVAALEALGMLNPSWAKSEIGIHFISELRWKMKLYGPVEEAAMKMLKKIDPDLRRSIELESKAYERSIPVLIKQLNPKFYKPDERKAAMTKLMEIGPEAASAVPDLIGSAYNISIAEEIISLLKSLLLTIASHIRTEDLHAIANLKNVEQLLYYSRNDYDNSKEAETKKVDCSRVRQLAQEELARRGINI